VVPVTIRGSRHVLVPKTWHVKSGKVDVIIGAPISSLDLSANDLAARTYETMLQTFSAFPDSSK
jgi:1-acyl-sn-glycerol-3-phosphate acyltransferase